MTRRNLVDKLARFVSDRGKAAVLREVIRNERTPFVGLKI
jgi:hypothetical protein